MPKANAPLLTLVVPVYNESDVLPLFFKRVKSALAKIDYEILMVDDGSRDDSALQIARAGASDKRIKLIRFSRNFGKEAAMTAGIYHATGQTVVPIDADLQDPPELIPAMIEKWRKGAKVVLATRQDREADGWLKTKTAGVFYRLFNALSKVKLPPQAGDFRLMDRQVVEALKQLPERTRFSKGLFSWVGFKTVELPYTRPARAAGVTKWNYWKLWNYALEGILSFSTIPLRMWTYLGLLLALFGFGWGIHIIMGVLISGKELPGYASLIVSILFIGGVQLIVLGVLGEYIGRVYEETKRRPLYLVAETVNLPDVK
jgi:glycosyltransferase involved in cell wall biosynthesis